MLKYYSRLAWWQFRVCILFCLFQSAWSWQHPNFTVPKYEDKSVDEIRDALYRHRIIPEVLARAPSHFLQITYTTEEAKNCTIGLGNVLNANQMDCFPFQLQWPSEKGEYFTLMFIDADYPSRQNRSQSSYLLWLLGNIPGSSNEYPMPDIFDCTQMTRYQPPRPAKGTGIHRYIYLAYKQRSKARFQEPDQFIDTGNDTGRLKFSPPAFVKQYRMARPWAVAFYLAEWVQPPPSTTYAPWDFTPETEDPELEDWSIEKHDKYLEQLEREKKEKKKKKTKGK